MRRGQGRAGRDEVAGRGEMRRRRASVEPAGVNQLSLVPAQDLEKAAAGLRSLLLCFQ